MTDEKYMQICTLIEEWEQMCSCESCKATNYAIIEKLRPLLGGMDLFK